MSSFEAPNGRIYLEENQDAIARVFLDALATADSLKERGTRPDCLIGREAETRKSIFRKKEAYTEFIEGWDMHGCEPAGIRSLALSTEGIIYLCSSEPMSGGDDQIPVMPHGVELSHTHFATFARADEFSERLQTMSRTHVQS